MGKLSKFWDNQELENLKLHCATKRIRMNARRDQDLVCPSRVHSEKNRIELVQLHFVFFLWWLNFLSTTYSIIRDWDLFHWCKHFLIGSKNEQNETCSLKKLWALEKRQTTEMKIRNMNHSYPYQLFYCETDTDDIKILQNSFTLLHFIFACHFCDVILWSWSWLRQLNFYCIWIAGHRDNTRSGFFKL